MKLGVVFRGYIGGMKQFEERVDITAGFAAEIHGLADKHVEFLMALPGGDRYMIEIEFLDEPDPLQRYHRIGTDPTMMVLPLMVLPIRGGRFDN